MQTSSFVTNGGGFRKAPRLFVIDDSKTYPGRLSLPGVLFFFRTEQMTTKEWILGGLGTLVFAFTFYALLVVLFAAF